MKITNRPAYQVSYRDAVSFFNYDQRIRALVYSWWGTDILALHSKCNKAVLRQLVIRAMHEICNPGHSLLH